MMRPRHLLSGAALAGLLLALSTGLAAPAAEERKDVAVLVHKDVPIDDLSLLELRRILVGDQQFWSGKLRASILIRAPGSPERDVLLRVIYRMNEQQFRQYWIAKVFRAETATPPRAVDSARAAALLVGRLPGAISFVAVSDIPKDSSLKVLKIDGLAPGESGYPLR